MSRFALGLDFGTESVRAIVVDCDNGREAARAVVRFAHGVITKNLPPDFALQDARDYADSLTRVIRAVLKRVRADRIIGVGVDFTACTILPVLRDGTPLMVLPKFRKNPHAFVKLWKHHAAQREADEINAVARRRGESFLKYYGGTTSSEWMLPKCLEIARKAPGVYRAAELIVDAGDWIVQQMTGVWTRNACAAGYKGSWNAKLGFPSEAFMRAVDPKIQKLGDKWLKNVVAPGERAGAVTAAFARRTGLRAGTPVSVATIDAHSGVAGMGIVGEGPASIIMGTSSCHMILSKRLKFFEGFAGVVKDGILPGFYGYESGQSGVGDVFAWFVKSFLGHKEFGGIARKAAALTPGRSGLVALDWMNGNRSVLMNADLSGMVLGLTMTTKPEEVYRALIEGTAFGTKIILDAYRQNGIQVTELAVCGGLVKDPLVLQIYTDVMEMPVRVAASDQSVALGAAVFGAMAAGVRDPIRKMTRPPTRSFLPNRKASAVYRDLFEIYRRCHDVFGREMPELMKQLKTKV